MSYLTPKHLEDVARILRGVALVAARAASDSSLLRRATASTEVQSALTAAANLLHAHAQHAHGAMGTRQSDPAAVAGAGISTGGIAASGPAGPISASGGSPLVEYLYPKAAAWADVVSPGAAWGEQPQPPALKAVAPAAAAMGTVAGQHVAAAGAEAAASRRNGTAQPSAAAAAAAAEEAAAAAAQGVGRAAGSVYPQAPLPAAPPVEQPAVWPPPRQWAPSAPQHQAAATADRGPYWERPGASTPAPSASPPAAAAGGINAAHPVSDPVPGAAHDAVGAGGASGGLPAAVAGSGRPVLEEPVGTWMSAHDPVMVAAEGDLEQRLSAEHPPQQQHQQRQQLQPQLQAEPEHVPLLDAPRVTLRERAVPSSQIGRAMGFAGMGASILFGTLRDSVARTLGGSGTAGAGAPGAWSNIITESNAERLAAALCRMRGAALKIGQMLSIQDEALLPPQIQSALERVRQGADVMPQWQLEQQMLSQLGPGWRDRMAEFDEAPRAAASIGQVHAGVLHDGRKVAIKVQYPGVARSISSDVDNLMRLISVANILPRGLYVENAVKVAKRELALECDYTYEAASQMRFKALVESEPQLARHFNVPAVIPELSAGQVLATEWVRGVSIDKVRQLPQEVRDAVGTRLLALTLQELFDWRFMQTDPNWGNFLYEAETDTLHLIDFGAAREYPAAFVDDYLRMVAACAGRDSQGVISASQRLGFLSGDESDVMLDAHCQAGFVVGMPFAAHGEYDFGSHAGMTARVSELGSIMLKHRLTPPPDESYSLHRKLSGAFLACMKLRARVPCRRLFLEAYERHDFSATHSDVHQGADAAMAAAA